MNKTKRIARERLIAHLRSKGISTGSITNHRIVELAIQNLEKRFKVVVDGGKITVYTSKHVVESFEGGTKTYSASIKGGYSNTNMMIVLGMLVELIKD